MRGIPLILLAAVAACCTGASAAQAPPAPPAAVVAPQVVHPIRPGLSFITGAGGNVTVFVSDHGLILVDDKLAGAANFDALVAAVRGISPLPVLAVFNTHFHPDHIGNNDRFLGAGVMVIGADGIDRLLAKGDNAARTPSILFTKDFSLVLMRGRVDAHQYPPGHTGADAVVHFPSVRAVATGDLVVATTPTIDYAGGANIGGWIEALNRMLALDFDVAIPGHGDAPMSRADVTRFRDHLTTFLARAHAAVAAGATEATLIGHIRTDDLGWTWNANAWPAPRLDGLWREAGGAG